MSFDKRRILLKTIIVSQVNYCPLVWISHGRGLNNKTNNLHERALRIVCQKKSQIFKFCLEWQVCYNLREKPTLSLN